MAVQALNWDPHIQANSAWLAYHNVSIWFYTAIGLKKSQRV